MIYETKLVPVGEIATIFDGPHATPALVDKGPIFLGIDALENGRLNLDLTRHVSEHDFIKWIRRVEPMRDDLVFSYETRIGQAALIPAGLRCCLGRRLALVRPNSTVLSSAYLLYYFLSPTFQEILRSKTIHGSTVDRIHLKEFPSFLIELPSLEKQRRITGVLSALDSKIDFIRRKSLTLEAIAQALFTSWFIDFDPVYSKIDGLDEYLPSSLAEIFPDKINDEGIPLGWSVGSIADLATVNPHTPLKKGIVQFVDMASLPTKGPRINRTKHRLSGSGARFKNGDTLIARITPCLENGKTALVDCLADDLVGVGSTEFIVMRPNPGTPGALPYLLSRHQPFRDQLITGMTGTSGRQRAQADGVKRYPLAVPTPRVLEAFEAVTSPMFRQIQYLGNEAKTLSDLRDTLLPKLVSGEISSTHTLSVPGVAA